MTGYNRESAVPAHQLAHDIFVDFFTWFSCSLSLFFHHCISWGLSVFPTANPVLSAGTYVATSNTPAQGNLIVFDTFGGGSVYTTLDSATPIVSSSDRVMSLSSQKAVDMSGIKLTPNAVPVTMVGVAYILDQVRWNHKANPVL